jgi:hypothetical protein
VALIFASVCSSGCVSVARVEIPPCPLPTEEAINELAIMEGWAVEDYVARIEQFCQIIEVLRE